VSRARSRRRPRADDEFRLPSSRRALTLADLPRNWNGQRKAWFEEALGLREQLLRGVYLADRHRMRIQESLFGQGEGLLVEGNYASDFELEQAGWPVGEEADTVRATCQANFAAHVGRHSVSDLVGDACDRHLEDLLFERRERRRTGGRSGGWVSGGDGGGLDGGGDDDSAAGSLASAEDALGSDMPSGDEFGGDFDDLDDGCDADAY
jgi:hypothetical protein